MTFGELAIEENGNKDYETGQHLVGVMIPHVRENTPGTAAPIGQLTKQKSMIKSEDIDLDIGDDSAMIAYAKLGSIAVFAAVVSYLTVPIMIRVLEGALSVLNDSQDL